MRRTLSRGESVRRACRIYAVRVHARSTQRDDTRHDAATTITIETRGLWRPLPDRVPESPARSLDAASAEGDGSCTTYTPSISCSPSGVWRLACVRVCARAHNVGLFLVLLRVQLLRVLILHPSVHVEGLLHRTHMRALSLLPHSSRGACLTFEMCCETAVSFTSACVSGLHTVCVRAQALQSEKSLTSSPRSLSAFDSASLSCDGGQAAPCEPSRVRRALRQPHRHAALRNHDDELARHGDVAAQRVKERAAYSQSDITRRRAVAPPRPVPQEAQHEDETDKAAAKQRNGRVVCQVACLLSLLPVPGHALHQPNVERATVLDHGPWNRILSVKPPVRTNCRRRTQRLIGGGVRCLVGGQGLDEGARLGFVASPAVSISECSADCRPALHYMSCDRLRQKGFTMSSHWSAKFRMSCTGSRPSCPPGVRRVKRTTRNGIDVAPSQTARRTRCHRAERR
jgi:hypothetical protein